MRVEVGLTHTAVLILSGTGCPRIEGRRILDLKPLGRCGGECCWNPTNPASQAAGGPGRQILDWKWTIRCPHCERTTRAGSVRRTLVRRGLPQEVSGNGAGCLEHNPRLRRFGVRADLQASHHEAQERLPTGEVKIASQSTQVVEEGFASRQRGADQSQNS